LFYVPETIRNKQTDVCFCFLNLTILRKEKKENVCRVNLHASEEEASARGILDFLKNADLRPKS